MGTHHSVLISITLTQCNRFHLTFLQVVGLELRGLYLDRQIPSRSFVYFLIMVLFLHDLLYVITNKLIPCITRFYPII